MTLYDYFNSIDLTEIERYILDKQEENISLEFKTVNHPNYNLDNREFDKKNYSEGLSGFANSNGGIIIWGVKAKENHQKQDVAYEKRPITELTKFLNILNRLEGQAVIPLITGIEHVKIEVSDDLGYIKSFIPASNSAPHMALYAGKHYYKRSGDSFYQCEHYDVIDMFSRKKSPSLSLIAKVHKRTMLHQVQYRYEIIISIANTGGKIAKFPYLAINCNTAYNVHDFGLDGNRNTGLQKVANNAIYRYNYSGGNNTVIYPETILNVDKFVCEVLISDAPEDLKIQYILSAEDMESIKGEIVVESRKILDECIF